MFFLNNFFVFLQKFTLLNHFKFVENLVSIDLHLLICKAYLLLFEGLGKIEVIHKSGVGWSAGHRPTDEIDVQIHGLCR